MRKLIVSREKSYYGWAVTMDIVLDGRVIGHVKNGEAVELQISEARHVVCGRCGLDITKELRASDDPVCRMGTKIGENLGFNSKTKTVEILKGTSDYRIQIKPGRGALSFVKYGWDISVFPCSSSSV